MADEEPEELTEEELEELRVAAALKASTDLLHAAKNNDSPMALASLELAGKVDTTEHESYWTPLHYASLNGDAPLVDGLIARGAHERYQKEAEKRMKRVLRTQQALLNVGPSAKDATDASLFEEDEDSSVFVNTPLHWSCFKGHMATTLSLLDAGYSLQDVDSVGNTPLHLAGVSQVLPVVELLLASGADPFAKNSFHLSPLDVSTAPPVRAALLKALSHSSGDATNPQTTAQKAQLKAKREVMRKTQSAELRGIAAQILKVVNQTPPLSLEEERTRVEELEEVKARAEGTNGVVDMDTISKASALIKRFKLASATREHLVATQELHPVVTQQAYTEYVNKLERYMKAGEKLAVDASVLTSCRGEIARSFAEYWLFKIEEELKVVECAEKELEPRIDLLEERIGKAQKAGGSQSLLESATKVLDRLRSEIALASQIEAIPPYKMPPAEEETSELNKKQLQAYMDAYWTEDDVGHLKETTEEEGCQPFPLPPGFAKEEDDEAWNSNPLKALINTPEGYIWVPSKALVQLRECARDLDVAIIRATNCQGFLPLIEDAKERLQQIGIDTQQLELKDETDMTLAEAVAAKGAKKMKAALKGKKKK